MNDQTTLGPLVDEDEDTFMTDDSLGASIVIDYAEIMEDCEPGAPGGRIVYDSYDYDTQEEADAALEEFFTRIIEAPHEEKN
jgi:hypothetical protein